MNRLTSIGYTDQTVASFGYDKNGNQVSMSNPNSTATFSFDARNRQTGQTWTIGGSQYTTTYRYDAVGSLASIVYPDGTVATYSIDALNRITSLTTNGASANFAYAANLKLKSISYGNNVQQAYTYDSRGRPARITISRLSNTLLDLRYSYDNVGNILSIYNSTSTESYTFDALNRLKSTTGTWGTLKYGYNATGDRLWMWNSNGSTNTTYSYGATSTSFNRLYSAGSTSYTYDNNGNIKTETTGSVTKYYSYDFENRLTKVTQGSSTLGSYGYSPNGVRLLSIESGSSTVSLIL